MTQSEVKSVRTLLRGKLIGVLGTVAQQVSNYEQLNLTASALYKVTNVSDEVTIDGKVKCFEFNVNDVINECY